MRNDFCENYLQHGKEWKNHKYVAKIKLGNGKWFYFYDAKIYQNYLARQQGKNKSDPGRFAKKDPNKIEPSDQLKNDKVVQELVSKKTPGATIEEKAKAMTNNIKAGTEAIKSLLEKNSANKAENQSQSKSSGGSKSSGSSSKSSGKKSSGGSKSSGSSKKSSGGSSKEKGSSGTKSTSKEKKTKDKKTQTRAFDSAAAMKEMFNISDSDVHKYKSVSEMLSSMKKYKDGSYGYLTAENTTYKWEKRGGKIVVIDMNTDKEISINKYLQDAVSIQEFRTDDKKSKYRKK